MREIIFDTETTGLSHIKGDRIIEIGAIELVNKFPTGKIYHQYINSDGFPIHPDAERVHGISADFLKDKPKFHEIVDEFLAFFSNAMLIAHNSNFDMGFVNSELKRLKMPAFTPEVVIDTLAIAKRKHPMGPNSLDALCKRYNIDNSRREKHGALLDSELLAEVYIELLGGKQASLELVKDPEVATSAMTQSSQAIQKIAKKRASPLPSRLNAQDKKLHQEFVETFTENAIWNEYK